MIEIRSFGVELKKEGSRIVGHTTVYSQVLSCHPSKDETGEFYADWNHSFSERIEPDAFYRSIHQNDVKALLNQNPEYVLGRTGDETLRMFCDEQGLKIIVGPFPYEDYAHRFVEMVEDSLITHAAFEFEPLEESWKPGDVIKDSFDCFDTRVIEKGRLITVSFLTEAKHSFSEIDIERHMKWRNRKNPDAFKSVLIKNLRERTQLKLTQNPIQKSKGEK